ncbi:phosphatidylcholine and lysophosphatidylcholine phospholipase [Gurleya vavrai]
MLLLFSILILIFSSIFSFKYYRKPLKYTNIKSEKKYIKNENGEKTKEDFTRFPLFTFSRTYKKFLDNVSDLCVRNIPINCEISENCYVLEGQIKIFCEDEIVAIKNKHSIIFMNKTSDKIKRIATKESKIIVFDSIERNYIFYFYKKMQVNVFCNFFHQTLKLIEYEKKNQKIINFVNKDEKIILETFFIKNLNVNRMGISNAALLIQLNMKNSNLQTIILNLKKKFYKKIAGVYKLKTKNYFNRNFKINIDDLENDLFITKNLDLNIYAENEEIVKKSNFVILIGEIEIEIDDQKHIFNEGGYYGYFDAYFNISNNYKIRAKQKTIILSIKNSDLFLYGFKQENFEFDLFYQISDLFLAIDSGCEWLRYQPGEFLNLDNETKDEQTFGIPNKIKSVKINIDEPFKNYDEFLNDNFLLDNSKFSHKNSIFFIDHGKLQVVEDKNEIKKFICTDSIIGNSIYFTDNKINTKYQFKKLTDIIKIDEALFTYVLKKYPTFAVQARKNKYPKEINKTCKTVAVIPSNEKYNLFYERLINFLPEKTCSIKNEKITQILGINAFDEIGELKFKNYLKEKEKNKDLIVLKIDSENISFFNFIVNNSDIVLLIGRCLISEKVYCSVELVNIYKSSRHGKKDEDSSNDKFLVKRRIKQKFLNLNKKIINRIKKSAGFEILKSNNDISDANNNIRYKK